MKYESVALLLGYNQVFFHPQVLDFIPIYFPKILSNIWKASLVFMGKDLIVQPLYVHLKVNGFGTFFQKRVVLQLIYIIAHAKASCQ